MASGTFSKSLENLESLVNIMEDLTLSTADKLINESDMEAQIDQLIEHEISTLSKIGPLVRSSCSLHDLERLVKAHTKLNEHEYDDNDVVGRLTSLIISISKTLHSVSKVPVINQPKFESALLKSWSIPIKSFSGRTPIFNDSLSVELEYHAEENVFNVLNGNYLRFLSKKIDTPPIVAVSKPDKEHRPRVRMLLYGGSGHDKKAIGFELEHHEYRPLLLGHLLDMGCSVIQTAENLPHAARDHFRDFFDDKDVIGRSRQPT